MGLNFRLIHIQSETLELPKVFPNFPAMGGYVLFAGIVRNINEGKSVKNLEYEAYPEMANQMIAEIIADAQKKWDIQYVHCIHRLGLLELGEVAVIVATGSTHREESFKANRFIIDKVKQEVPIWKREYFTDGQSEWSKGCLDPTHEH